MYECVRLCHNVANAIVALCQQNKMVNGEKFNVFDNVLNNVVTN